MRGKRCKFSDEGRQTFTTRPDREGIILGESNDGKNWRVHWDGLKAPTSFHKSFITVLE